VETLLLLLSPFAPHLSDELWQATGREGFLYDHPWPVCDPALLRTETITLVVQVNGKVRGKVTVPDGADENTIWQAVLQEPQITRWLDQKEPRKKVYVPGKLLNIVA
ncbi:MAG TPA: class I tRNA ligase family protein, partial [bacterium]|nr:class I tRNA ligase family protein [bacterium]